MRNRLNRKNIKLRKDEAGYALMWVLVMIILAGIILVPLLLLMTAGLTSSEQHEDRMLRFYAADAGIEDAAYKIQNDDSDLPLTTANPSWNYGLDEEVNGYQVDVTIEYLWVLAGLESDRNGTLPHAELVVVGSIIEEGTYQVVFSYDGSVGQLKIDRVGVWLPSGYSYVPGSSYGITTEDPDDIIDAAAIEAAGGVYGNDPPITSTRGGTALRWEFNNVNFEDLPPPGGGQPGSGEFPIKRVLTFQYTPASPDPVGSFSWIRTNRTDIYLSWDVASGTYQVTSTAGETTIESYIIRAKPYDRIAEVYGDYRAIGQSLMKDASGSGDDWQDYGIRDTLLFGTSAKDAEIDDIPDGAKIEMAYLYWSAWRSSPQYAEVKSYTNNTDVSIPDNDGWVYSPITVPSGDNLTITNIDVYVRIPHSAKGNLQVKVVHPDGTEHMLHDRTGGTTDNIYQWYYNIATFNGKDSKGEWRLYVRDQASGNTGYINYWTLRVTGSADLTALATGVNEAKFEVPGQSAQWVTANRVQILPNKTSSGDPHGWSYSCRADVTSLIPGNGNGEYTVKEIEGITSSDLNDQWSYAGWSLFIVYSSAEEEAHQLYLYDDFLYAHNDTTTVLEDIEGFLAPEDSDGRLTVFVGEGDNIWEGDKLKFNGNYLPYSGDPYDGVNLWYNVWNGKSSGLDGKLIDGVDIDTFDASPYIDADDTSAEVRLETESDSWNLVYVILSFRTVPGTESGLFPVGFVTYSYESY